MARAMLFGPNRRTFKISILLSDTLLSPDLLKAPLHGPHQVSKNEVSLIVWAPNAKKLKLELVHSDRQKTLLEMKPMERGYHSATCEATEGTEYSYIINGKKRPDPASRFQPEGVHGRSSLIFPGSFRWHDHAWKGIPKADLIIYEIHVGTFSRGGTFESVIPYLNYLKDLGVTAIEIMPVAQFSGKRNWGYDGVDLYAPQNSYGGPFGLKKLVDHCHLKELSVILDVVYNHLGPEGNYLGDFGPYFSHRHITPWGPAINYDGPGSDEVRKFYVQNALYWIEEFHVDGLRLDAVDKIFDFSPRNILLDIEQTVHASAEARGKEVHVIAETDLNDPKLILPVEEGGYSIDAQWSDDFHHSVHSFLTGERFGYYVDFGRFEDIAKALASAFVYDGQYSTYRKKSHGAPAEGLDGGKFVYFIQNHDMVGNHRSGKRLSSLLVLDKLKVAVALLVLSQSIPMLFMGEEYAEEAPFLYFVDHSDNRLIQIVREGRKRDHEYFVKVEDPEALSTFLRSKLNHSLKSKGVHRLVLGFYRDLLRLRKSLRPLRNLERKSQEILVLDEKRTIIAKRRFGQEEVQCVFVLGNASVIIENPVTKNHLRKVFDSTRYAERPESGKIAFSEDNSGDLLELKPFSVTVFAK